MCRSNALGAFVVVLSVACVTPRAPSQGATAPASIADLRRDPLPGEHAAAPRPHAERVRWEALHDDVFARAKALHKLVLLDVSAEWCHWCHVMENVTYADPEVRALVAERFLAVKVDVDARPDIEARYREYGWPATVVFSEDGTELGKFRGYIPPAEMVSVLGAATRDRDGRGAAGRAQASRSWASADRSPVSAQLGGQLDVLASRASAALERYYDTRLGGWGGWQKFPIGQNNAWLASRAEHGDRRARAQLEQTLTNQVALLDPVFGGIYQYSVESTWTQPHFEKLGTMQAEALENYAAAYAITGAPFYRAAARSLFGFMEAFFRNPQGGFFANQDADLNVRERDSGAPFLPGASYYALGRDARLRLGLPFRDRRENGRENGAAIRAYARYALSDPNSAEAPRAKREAMRAVTRYLQWHAPWGTTREASGQVSGQVSGQARERVTLDAIAPSLVFTRTTLEGEPLADVAYLADQVAMAQGVLALSAVTQDVRYEALARALGRGLRAFRDDDGVLFASTLDPRATGAFAVRAKPLQDNVAAAQLWLDLAGRFPEFMEDARVLVQRLSAPTVVEELGRVLGNYLFMLQRAQQLLR
jgi:hypothetical protein